MLNISCATHTVVYFEVRDLMCPSTFSNFKMTLFLSWFLFWNRLDPTLALVLADGDRHALS
jgi:hypothetical protein